RDRRRAHPEASAVRAGEPCAWSTDRLTRAGARPPRKGASVSTRTPRFAILPGLNSSADSRRITRVYLLVVICEIAVVSGLWLLDRFYS
ncbi:MAG: hypothetical protein ACREH3_02740, partial [Geminicoccales bacterium]